MRNLPTEVEYALHDGIHLRMDIYIPARASIMEPAPVYMWLHYGGLVQVGD